VAIINCEPSFANSFIKHKSVICLLGDNAASGSSNIYSPFLVKRFWTNWINASPCDTECRLFSPYPFNPSLSISDARL
jgi:hypothetical protein